MLYYSIVESTKSLIFGSRINIQLPQVILGNYAKKDDFFCTIFMQLLVASKIYKMLLAQ